MEIDVSRRRQAAIFQPAGRIEGSNADQFHQSVNEAVQPTDQAVIIDLQQVPYVSSAGLKAFAIIFRQSQARNIPFALTNPSKHVYDVIHVTGFNKVMNVFDTAEEAISQLLPSNA